MRVRRNYPKPTNTIYITKLPNYQISRDFLFSTLGFFINIELFSFVTVSVFLDFFHRNNTVFRF